MSDRRIATASICLALLTGACRPGEVPPSAPSAGAAATTRMPQVRVGLLLEATTVTVGASAGFELSATDFPAPVTARAADVWTVSSRSDGVMQISNGARTLTSRGPVRVHSDNGRVRVDDRTYRGDALLRLDANGVTAVNLVGLEDYLLGVVPREIGQRPVEEIEAVKAQAVAARTYAIANLGGRNRLGFDYFADTQDQVYGGAQDEDAVTTRAVHETRGEVVTYEGVPILAYYSSTCGGRTAAIEDSWPGRTPVPYLKSVSDRVPGSDRHYCDPSNRFRWTVTWTRPQLLSVLGESLRDYTGGRTVTLGRLRAVSMHTNGSGRATVEIEAERETFTLRADSIRWVLRQPGGGSLNSSYLEQLEATTGEEGDVSELTVHGGGWGHAIGMCQFGAIGRARAGQKHTEILRTYYLGTDITRLY